MMNCKAYHCRKMQLKKMWIPIVVLLLLLVQKMYQVICMGQSSPYCSFRSIGPRPCGCKQCISEKGVSAWFDERFNSSVNPLLTAQNPEIPVNVQRWWLKLQGSNNEGQVQEALDKLFAEIPAEDLYSARGETQCRTCAVVGNSGNLKGSKYGERIDSHHFVLSTYMKVKQFIKADKDKVLIFNPSFLKYVHENWIKRHGKYPSTGMLALFFAIHICDEVSVFGYGADSNGDWHHYWERNKFAGAFRRTRVHNAEFELDLIRQLVHEGKVTYYR
ncbi:CMP-N-acetylneuraminate-beta-galactosamide-alpha-2,3-sialyltransferase 2-like isoform X2 [Pleurodeles waltl]|uniref:CMP-N-acetylneuraminate-beta-galactosamide- alpha-2,3-sialyltransferase 2-like isoform X2 n=1 Tax=Pleurodeles waltl TaxID=8319 RepID=UPI00370937BA